jgi:glycosyltransferase involved in cell wall biosynthesis
MHSRGSGVPELQIVMPVHNEGGSIEATLKEWYHALTPRVNVEFITCEDGSTDDTKRVLTRLSGELPLRLLMADGRKGYSRAVIDGFAAATAPYILAVDGDGQCDPADFWKFWERRDTHDVIIGWRTHRADPLTRRIMSASFRAWFTLLFPIALHDPSCPYLLIRQHVLEAVRPRLGVLDQGFWWEFVARTHRAGFKIVELPVASRVRTSGRTQIYTARRIPRIAIAHGLGLIRIWLDRR